MYTYTHIHTYILCVVPIICPPPFSWRILLIHLSMVLPPPWLWTNGVNTNSMISLLKIRTNALHTEVKL